MVIIQVDLHGLMVFDDHFEMVPPSGDHLTTVW
jgi:hypothetical protein